jgi:hypothetical protein
MIMFPFLFNIVADNTWHRNMLYVFLALHFLLRLRLRFKKNACAHVAPSPGTISDSAAAQVTDDSRCPGDCAVPHQSQPHCLSIAQEKEDGIGYQ